MSVKMNTQSKSPKICCVGSHDSGCKKGCSLPRETTASLPACTLNGNWLCYHGPMGVIFYASVFIIDQEIFIPAPFDSLPQNSNVYNQCETMIFAI